MCQYNQYMDLIDLILCVYVCMCIFVCAVHKMVFITQRWINVVVYNWHTRNIVVWMDTMCLLVQIVLNVFFVVCFGWSRSDSYTVNFTWVFPCFQRTLKTNNPQVAIVKTIQSVDIFKSVIHHENFFQSLYVHDIEITIIILLRKILFLHVVFPGKFHLIEVSFKSYSC